MTQMTSKELKISNHKVCLHKLQRLEDKPNAWLCRFGLFFEQQLAQATTAPPINLTVSVHAQIFFSFFVKCVCTGNLSIYK